ncbi:MAG: hypothetical protein ACM3RX_09145 [Methanococcaceae archaeon]
MKKILLKISLVLLILMVLLVLMTKFYIEPWLGKEIKTQLRAGYDYTIDIKIVNIDIIRSELDLIGVRIYSNTKYQGYSGEIGTIKFTGIRIIKAVIKHDLYVDEVIVSKSSINGKMPFPERLLSPVVSPLKISIGGVLFDQFNLKMENDSTGQNYSVTEGMLRIQGLEVSKMDTLYPGSITLFDFKAGEANIVSSDIMYSWLIKGINYSGTLKTLVIDSLFLKPKYKDYDFTSRFKFQRSCIEAVFSDIAFHDFYADSYFSPMVLSSSYIEIGEMNMKVFRDKRKELRHEKKPAFQEILYKIPTVLRIDSITLAKGGITYKVHAEDSKAPGMIVINAVTARLLNVTNDTLFKKKNSSLEFKADARLMGKGGLSILLKSKLFDKNNTFSVNGSLSDLDLSELNPILENNADIYATGKLDAMNFSFVADNVKARGRMTMLYHGLVITVKDKRSDDTLSVKARLFSYFANRRILDSNPLKGEEARVGTIYYERDPERFLFHYCFRSILTGISSTLSKDEKNSKSIVQTGHTGFNSQH